MKITVEKIVNASLKQVWDAWNNPADIKQWNSAQDDWHTTKARSICARAASSCRAWKPRTAVEGFDFEGTYTRVVPHKTIEYRMSDGREVKVESSERAGGVI